MKLKNLGWIIAAGMGATLLASGFQNQTSKVGVVDLQTVFQNSDYFQQKQDQLKAMGQQRSDLLDFIKTYQTITPDQAQQLKTLSLKQDLTASEKTQLDKLKNDVQTNEKAFDALNTKQNPTDADKAKLAAFNDQRNQTANLYDAWEKEFSDDLNGQKEKFRQDVLDRVTGAVQDNGKKQGYTLIFASDVAPFGTNDVTNDTLKVMNAKK